VARHLNALSFAALTVLVLAAAAAAQGASPAVGVYGGQGGNIQGQVGGVASGALPFTGTSLVFVVAAGLALLFTGFLLVRGRRAES
jgi:hypothetical protein